LICVRAAKGYGQFMGGTWTNAKIIRPIPSRRRCFSPQRAGRTLVLLRRIVVDLARSQCLANDLEESVESARTAGMEALAEAAAEEMRRAGRRVRQCLDELEEVGVEMQDWRMGMVDFPARDGRREIRLCWRWGEPCVAHWHEADETCAERKSIAVL
jgi:hypothetical protein